MVFTLAKEFVQSKGIFLDKPFGRKVDNTSDLINSNTIHTPTVLFRHDAYLMYAQEIGFNRGWAVGDYPIWIYISTKYKIHLIEEATTVYRILENSASHSTNIDKTEKYLNSVCDMLQFFIEKYSLGQIEKMQERRNRVLFDNAFRYRDKKRADIYFNRICNKSLKLYIKYFILKSKFFNT